jgi:SAM-dependent methyltransferase
MSDSMTVFDRKVLRQRRDRRAGEFAGYDFLVREAADRLLDRLEDVTRSFPTALDLGCHTGQIADMLQDRGGIETLIQCDLSPAMTFIASANGNLTVAADEECLPFADGSFDLVLSCLSLHWVNDLPGTLLQIKRILKPDGLFLGVMLGNETLQTLRLAFAAAEQEIEGGISPRVSPFADVRDVGRLLQRANFSLPVADSDRIEVRYAEPWKILDDLRGMGESNAVLLRRKQPLRRQTLMSALQILATEHIQEDGRIPMVFDLVGMTGWAS